MKRILFITFCICITHYASSQTTTTHRSCCTPKTTDKDWYASDKKAPLFKGLDGINFTITTSDAEAQKYFNQGLMLSYAFNHAEAARSFYQSTRQDSTCAMCWWGYALVLGPNYNGGMESDNFQRAYDASQKAFMLASKCTEKEKELIKALTKRYAAKPGSSRTHLDSAYAEAMRGVYKKYPDDVEVGSLFAESLMDIHPWDLWEKSGTAKPWTAEIVTTLESILKKQPNHAGANHFYIHAVEASKTAERAMASADLLRNLVPGAGHLVHMPSHIYIRTGRYHEASLANLAAVKVDSNYVETCHAFGVYPLAYYPHNYHFLAATATFEGNSNWAMMASRKVAELSDKKLMQDSVWGTLQHYFSIPYYVMVKFGMWDELIKEPMPPSDLIYPTAVLHYAKAMAHLGKNDMPSAFREINLLKRLSADKSLSKITVWYLNSVTDLLQIAQNVVEGELALKTKQTDQAIIKMKKAVEMEDKLNYDEPPDWFFSVRHHLGAAYLSAGKYAEAEKVYNEDLETYRENGWALIGLYNALQKQGKTEEADAVKKRFDAAWKYADVTITGSRIM